jgi:5'-phosphate synthase pdxT subunit
MIMMAHEITEEDPSPLGIMDIGVHRNAFGRQVDSFEQDLDVSIIGETPFPGVFIRAPAVIRVGSEVDVLASLPSGVPVAVQQGNLLATAFHPELTDDTRFHRHFLDLIPVRSE